MSMKSLVAGLHHWGVTMKFVAYERTLQGTGASRRLRNAQKVPGIVYGAGTPAMIEISSVPGWSPRWCWRNSKPCAQKAMVSSA